MSSLTRICLLLGAWVLAGCATDTFAPSLVRDGTVTQPAVGFDGVRFALPPGYASYAPEPKGTRSWSTAQWAWSMSTDSDKLAGATALEHVAFRRGGAKKGATDFGITVAWLRRIREVPSPSDREAYEREVEREARTFAFSSGDVDLREASWVGALYVARLGRRFENYQRFNAVDVVLIPPRTLMIVNGVSHLSDREALIGDMETVLGTLDFEGKLEKPYRLPAAENL